MNEELKKVQDFFKTDIDVKKEIYDSVPNMVDMNDIDLKMKYVEDISKKVKEIKSQMLKVKQDFDVPKGEEISDFFAKIQEKILHFNYNNGDVQSLYMKTFADMDEKLIDEVNEVCVGYTGIEPSKLFNKCSTINELLHVYHSYVCNNEEIYQSMPKLCEPKKNEAGYPIRLYGVENELARKIFDDFPLDMSCGWTDILSLDDRVLMMVRDRGHALTIEMQENENHEITMNYFIPKICNVDMVNQLKGVRKVDDKSSYTKGIINTSKENAVGELFQFISGVPMDKDMIIPNYEYQKEQILKLQQEQKQKQGLFNSEQMTELSETRRSGEIRKAYQGLIDNVKNNDKQGEISNEQSRNV